MARIATADLCRADIWDGGDNGTAHMATADLCCPAIVIATADLRRSDIDMAHEAKGNLRHPDIFIVQIATAVLHRPDIGMAHIATGDIRLYAPFLIEVIECWSCIY